MCGIICAFKSKIPRGRTLSHRGPDDPNCEESNDLVSMRFSRLSINGGTTGKQPFVDGNHMMICNGEIYNFKEFSNPSETSDCKALFDVLKLNSPFEVCKSIAHTEFAFCYWNGYELWVARDPIGVRPLFYTRPPGGGIIFSSEAKILAPRRVRIFPPGHVYCSATDSFVCYCPLMWKPPPTLEWKTPVDNLRNALINAVVDRTDMSERPVAFLLSGGLDSSLVAAIACKHSKNNYVYTFTIGKEDSPDAKAANEVSQHLKTLCEENGKNYHHTHIDFDFEMGFNFIPKVIYDIESYDTTTIRASVPMWMLCDFISKSTPCKVVMSGEGADELLAGYKYFTGAPTASELFYETIRRVQKLHQFDVLRADRCTASHGLEVRVPFLDKRVVDACMQVHPLHKMTTHDKMEKTVLREAFQGYLPNNILWRRKDAFSDAVGYDWVTFVKNKFENEYPEYDRSFKHCRPVTNEEAVYRRFFQNYFGKRSDGLISEIWRPKWTDVTEPSARHLKFSNDN